MILFIPSMIVFMLSIVYLIVGKEVNSIAKLFGYVFYLIIVKR